jgi:hypothetical protein
MGRVFLAEEARLSRQVVVKVLPLYQHADPELQPAVREVRQSLGRLAQEPGT